LDRYKIDGHKLNYHVIRVTEWLKDNLIYPIYMEISPSGACNHRCIFCAQDFMGYQKRYLETSVLKERLKEMGRLGLKSAMFAGEGEPFLHKDITDIILHTKQAGIDVAITTNGVLMTRSISEKILDSVEWIKVSCNAGSPETYSKIHRTKSTHFGIVIHNLEEAVNCKEKYGYECVIGVQILLLPENAGEVANLIRISRDIGVNYLVVKPYSQHPKSHTDFYENIRYKEYEDLVESFQEYNTDTFSVIVRLKTMKKWDKQAKPYNRCNAHFFWSHLDAGGNIWGCSNYLGDEVLSYGNIYEKSFKDIWIGEKRRKAIEWFESSFDITQCRVNCRMDEINRYLWELKHPPQHVNFI